MVSLLERGLRAIRRQSVPQDNLVNSTRRGVWNNGQDAPANVALQLTAVYAAIAIIAGTVAAMPIQVLIKGAKSRQPVQDPELDFLWKRPNPNDTKLEFWEFVVSSLLIHGNAFIWKARDEESNTGPVEEIWAIAPHRVKVGQATDRTKVYVLDNDTDQPWTDHNIIHIKAMGTDGLLGLSPLGLARRSVEIGLEAEETAASFYKNGAHIKGVLKTDQDIDKDTADEYQERWENSSSGAKKAGKIAVLGFGLDFEGLQITPEEAQFLQTREYTVRDIARLYRVPDHLINAQGATSRFGTGIEQQNIGFVQFTTNRWTVGLEQSVDDGILEEHGQDRELKFAVQSLLRGDAKSRAEFYAKGRQNGWLSANDIRALEDLDPIETDEADAFWTPLNMSTERGQEDLHTKTASASAGDLIRSGFEPDDVLETVGLPTMDHLELPPVTLQKPEEDASGGDGGGEDDDGGGEEFVTEGVVSANGHRRDRISLPGTERWRTVSEARCPACNQLEAKDVTVIDGAPAPQLQCRKRGCGRKFDVAIPATVG